MRKILTTQLSFEVLWKQPIVENRRLPIEPIFPSDCEMQEVGPPSITASALIQRWRTNCALGNAATSRSRGSPPPSPMCC